MPYKSEKQRRLMHAKHPEIAARWDAEYGTKVKKSMPGGIGSGGLSRKVIVPKLKAGGPKIKKMTPEEHHAMRVRMARATGQQPPKPIVKSAWGIEHVVSKRVVKVGEYIYHTTKNTLPRLNLEDATKPRLARRAVTHVYDTKGVKVGHFTTTRNLHGEGKKTSQIHYASHLRPGSGIGEEALRQSMRSLKTNQFAHSSKRTGHGDRFTRRTSRPETWKSPRPTGDASNLKRATGAEEKVSFRTAMRTRAFSYTDADNDYLMSSYAHKKGKVAPTFSDSRAARHAVVAVPTVAVGGSAGADAWDKRKKKKNVKKMSPDSSALHVMGSGTMRGPGRLKKVKRKKTTEI
jgi:hypothetical protein